MLFKLEVEMWAPEAFHAARDMATREERGVRCGGVGIESIESI